MWPHTIFCSLWRQWKQRSLWGRKWRREEGEREKAREWREGEEGCGAGRGAISIKIFVNQQISKTIGFGGSTIEKKTKFQKVDI